MTGVNGALSLNNRMNISTSYLTPAHHLPISTLVYNCIDPIYSYSILPGFEITTNPSKTSSWWFPTPTNTRINRNIWTVWSTPFYSTFWSNWWYYIFDLYSIPYRLYPSTKRFRLTHAAYQMNNDNNNTRCACNNKSQWWTERDSIIYWERFIIS